MTTFKQTNTFTTISLLLTGKASKQVRLIHKLDIHCITVLVACYLLRQYVKPLYTLSDIQSFVTYYNGKRMRYYINKLVSCDLLSIDNLSRKYYITDSGIDNVISIDNRLNDLVYSFCSKYSIEL
jgi:hypothetical protein